MSWPLLLPFAAMALYMRGVRHAGWLALGAAIPAVVLAPTFLKYGLGGGSGGAATNLYFHIVSPDRLLVTLAQFFSFASLEINRFVATDNAKRLMFIVWHPWIVPLAAVVLVAGFVQPVWMLVSAFRRLALPGAGASRLAAPARYRRVHRRSRLRELLVRQGGAAGSCVLRGGADCLHFRRVVLDAHRLAPLAACRGRGACRQRFVPCGAGMDSGSRAVALHQSRCSGRRDSGETAGDLRPPAAVRESMPAPAPCPIRRDPTTSSDLKIVESAVRVARAAPRYGR